MLLGDDSKVSKHQTLEIYRFSFLQVQVESQKLLQKMRVAKNTQKLS